MACFQFYYHMYGMSIGTLRIFIKEKDQSTPLEPSWELTGNQGEQWLTGQIEIRPKNVRNLKPFQIIIEGIIGFGHQGDIAIDDLSLILGKSCTSISTNSTVEIINDSMAVDLDDNQWLDNPNSTAIDNNNANNGTFDEVKIITPGIFRSIVDMNENKTNVINLNINNINSTTSTSSPITTTTPTSSTFSPKYSSTLNSLTSSEDKKQNPINTTATTNGPLITKLTTTENSKEMNNSINEQPEQNTMNKNQTTELDSQSIGNKSGILDKHSLAILESNKEEIGHSLPLASDKTKNINANNKNPNVGKYKSSHWSIIISLIGLLVILSALIYFLYTNWPVFQYQNNFKAIFTGSRCNFFHLNTNGQRQDDDSEMLVTPNNLHSELCSNDDNSVYDNDLIRIH